MNKLNYEILSAIDNIETTVMESEMNVINSLMDSYGKAVMILENCDDNVDTSSFDIFQEGFFMEADENGENNTVGNKPKKSIKEIIIDILLFIPRMIKKFYNFIKRKINNMVKSVNEAIVNKLKKKFGVGEDEDIIGFKIRWIPGRKPEVTVTTESHDTEKEEKIKSKIESAISSMPTQVSSHTKGISPFKSGVSGSGTQALSNVSPFKSGVPGNSGTKALSSVNKVETSVEISKDDFLIGYFDETDTVNVISSTCKSIGDLFTTIDINRMGEPKYNQEFAKKLNGIITTYDKGMGAQMSIERQEVKYKDYVKYTNNLLATLNTSMNMLKNCSDTLEKSIMLYKNKNKLNNMPEKAIKGESGDIIKSINMMKDFIFDLVCDVSSEINIIEIRHSDIKAFLDIQSNNSSIVESYYNISDEEVIQEFFFTTKKNIKKRMMKYFPDFLDDMKRLNEACEDDGLTVGMVSRMYKSNKTTYRTRNTSEDGTYSIEMDESYEVQTKHMKTLLAVNEYCDKACSRKRCEGAFTTSERRDIFELNEQIEKFYYDLLDLFADESEKSLSRISKDISIIYPLAKKVYEYIV